MPSKKRDAKTPPPELDLSAPLDFGADFGLNLDQSPEDMPVDAIQRMTQGLERARAQVQGDGITPPGISDAQDLEEEFQKTADSVVSQLAAQARASNATASANSDMGYFITIVFLSKAQVDAFLEETGWGMYGNPDLDGIALCLDQGIELPKSEYAPRELKGDRRLAEIAMTPEELLSFDLTLPDLE